MIDRDSGHLPGRDGSVSIRSADPRDAGDLVALFEQWGHPQPENRIQAILERWSSTPFSAVLLAECRGQVAGMVAVSATPRLADPGRNAIVAGLVVGADHRRTGVGGQLLDAAEALAREWGCVHLELTSSWSRDAAHAFYPARGYSKTSEQQARCVRPLAAAPTRED